LRALCDGNSRDIEQLRRLLHGLAETKTIDDLGSSPLMLEALMQLPGLGPGNHVGDWCLLERIATGGMSEVFLARRDRDGIVQHAALKLLAVGFEGQDLQRRFARECRILATLSDARIARFYDSGIASDGRPWLAMEQVEGQPLDRHVAAHALRLHERIGLFLELAGAVAHAHRHLVVHRDLKPANVLVTPEGQLKLIDFGIARAIDEDGAITAVETRMLTLDFASPEQLQGGIVGIASDIYQLGLLLYRLVAGVHPFEGHRHERLQQIRAILDAEPELPSRALRRQGERGLAKRVHGDLDAIVLRALAKTPGERYASVDQLSADLVAWREHRPVAARPAGRCERFGKFVGRHRAASVATLSIFIAGTVFGSAWLAQTLRANQAAQTAEAVLSMLEQTLNADGYGVQPQPAETVSALLDQTEQRAQIALAEQPAVQARTLLLIGRARLGRGEYHKAALSLRRALALAEKMEDPLLVGDVAVQMINALHYSGDYVAAMHWSTRRVDRAGTPTEQLYALVPHGDLLHSLGQYEQAEAALRRAQSLATQIQDDGGNAYARQMLALVLRDRGALVEARLQLDEAVRIERSRTKGASVALAVALDNYGQVQLQQGDLIGAGVSLREAKAIRDHLFQPGYLSRSWVDHRLALLALANGEIDAAIEQLATMIGHYQRDLGEASHITALARSDLGWALLAGGRRDEAENQFEQADRVLAVVNGGNHPRRAELMLGKAMLALARGEREQAGDLAEAAFALRRRGSYDSHPMVAAICRIARACGRVCGTTEAVPTAIASRQIELARIALAL
jgi:serine/threonine-protein kinase